MTDIRANLFQQQNL